MKSKKLNSKIGLLGVIFILSQSAGAATRMIPNGKETKAFPAVVRLDIESQYMCTGTIIGKNTIITAAHCLKESDPSHPSITITDLYGNSFKAEKIISHPFSERKKFDWLNDVIENFADWEQLTQKQKEYARRLTLAQAEYAKHDIGLIKIRDGLSFSSYIPIKMHTEQSVFKDLRVTLLGYGRNDSTAVIFDGAGTRREGTNHIGAVWNGIFFTTGLVHDKIYKWGGLYTEADGIDAGIANGDSGGAMLENGSLVGVSMASLDASVEIETYRNILGSAGEKIYKKVKETPHYEWNLFVSLSDFSNFIFLKEAEKSGYQIQYSL